MVMQFPTQMIATGFLVLRFVNIWFWAWITNSKHYFCTNTNYVLIV